jgi:iron complex outermembrane receptor protein
MARQATPAFSGPVGRIDDSGFYVFDRISWGDYVDVMAGGRFGNYNDITIRPAKVKNFHATPATTSEGIAVKPFGNSDLSIYASYVEALESAPGGQITVNNPNQPLPPLPSTQREIGVKSEFFEGLLLTADYFDIHRAATYINAANFFVEDGQRKYEGFEASAAGRITDELSITANVLYLMAKNLSGAATCGPGTAIGTLNGSCKTFTPTIVGLEVSNTAKFYSSLFAEYKLGTLLPSLEGAAINGGMYYTGSRPLNDLNQGNLGGYATFDLGVSYATDAFEYPLIFRINAANVGNIRYWSAGDGNILTSGETQNITFSVTMNL